MLCNVQILKGSCQQKLTVGADNYTYGTKMDIYVKDKQSNEYYIPVVVGDIKRHSAPDGLYQTGLEISSKVSRKQVK